MSRFILGLAFAVSLLPIGVLGGGKPLMAGVAKRDITRKDAPAEGANRLWVKALVLSRGEDFQAVVVSVDAVAIAGIGSIRDPFLENVRTRVHRQTGIAPQSILINASHCHGVVAPDVEDRTVDAIHEAWLNRVPVTAGSGIGYERGIQENRRLKLKNGKEIDVRRAYALPANEAIAAVGPIDPEIGVLRLDRVDSGATLALVYQFAVHPIKGIPGGGNTADLVGFASEVIESSWGSGSTMALFLQGCGGDINPLNYKNVNVPHDAEPLGQSLGLSVVRAAKSVVTENTTDLAIDRDIMQLPRADHSVRIEQMGNEIDNLLKSLRGTSLDFETFLPLYVKYHINSGFPSEKAQRYLQDELLGKNDWRKLDAGNRSALEAYRKNIQIMEDLTRKQINLALLKKHQASREKEGDVVAAEVAYLRVGEFHLLTFPAELTVPVGLKIKRRSPHQKTFVSGYTNGYLFYAPTAEQARNRGGAQEDSDCLLAPGWEAMFIDRAAMFLGGGQ